jgi:hypothetical protein
MIDRSCNFIFAIKCSSQNLYVRAFKKHDAVNGAERSAGSL